MTRSSLTPQHTARARRPQDAPDSQHSRGATVLPFRSEFDRRNDVSNALVGLADAWRSSTLEIRDEASWAAYAADASMSLTRYLVQHAVIVRAAMIESGYPSPADDMSADDELARSLEDADDQDDWADDCAAAAAQSAADAVLLAFIGVINTLVAGDDAVFDIDDVAGPTSAADDPDALLDVARARHAARQAS